MQKATRFLAALLAAFLLVGLAPVQAFAAVPPEGEAVWTAQAEPTDDAPAEAEAPANEAPAGEEEMPPPQGDEPLPPADEEPLVMPEAEGDGDFSLAAESGTAAVGQTFNLDFSAMEGVQVPAGATNATLSWKFMRGDVPAAGDIVAERGNGATAKAVTAGAAMSTALSTAFNVNTPRAFYITAFADAGKKLYCEVVFTDGAGGQKGRAYHSNPIALVLPLNSSSAVAGTFINGGLLTITYQLWNYEWHTIDAQKNDDIVKQGANQIASPHNNAPYMLKDADVGKQLYLRLIDAADTSLYYDSELRAVTGSLYTEVFDFTVASFQVAQPFNTNYSGGGFSWGIQGFTSYNGNQYGDAPTSSPNVIAYHIQLMAAADNAASADDIELAGTQRDTGANLAAFSYTFKAADAGKYVYVQLTSLDLRRPLYRSALVPVLARKLPVPDGLSLYVGSDKGYASATLNTTDLPGYTAGYTYKYLRTTGAEDAAPVVVAEGSGKTSPLPSYHFTDADIGCQIYAEVTGVSATARSEPTGTVLPRRLKLTAGSTMGAAVGVGTEAGTNDTALSAGTQVAYTYYRTDDAEGAGGVTAANTAQKGTVTAAAGGKLNDVVPTYTLRPEDDGKYLHLALVIGGHTYTLHPAASATTPPLTITGEAYQGKTVTAVSESYSAYFAIEPGMRYEWRAKSAAAAAPTDADPVLGSGTASASVPSCRLGEAAVGKYVYLALIPAEGAPYYSSADSVIGPVKAVTRLDGGALTLAISGSAVVGETLTARITPDEDGTLTGSEDITISWYYYDEGKREGEHLGDGWTFTVPEEATGHPIYAVAEGDGYTFYDNFASGRTTPALGKLSREATGIQSVSASMTGGADIGFVTTGAGAGKREPITFEVVLHYAGALPADGKLPADAWLRLETLDAAGSPHYDYCAPGTGTLGAGALTFKNTSFEGVAGDALRSGASTVSIALVEKDGNAYKPYEAYPATVPVVALAALAVDVPAAVEVVEGESTMVQAILPAGATPGYRLADAAGGPLAGTTGLTVDATGRISAAADCTVTSARLIVTATAGRQFGSASVAVTVVAQEDVVKAADLAIKDKAAAKTKLEALMVGFDSDPFKTNEKLNTTLQLEAAVAPANATANYTLRWKSSNEAAAVVDSHGLVRVKAAGQPVTISVTLCAADGTPSTDPRLTDSIAFTTGTPRYAPKAITYGTKTITLTEQTGRYLASNTNTPGLPYLKVKYRVDGKSDRTLRAPIEMFTYRVKDENIATVDADGMLHAIKPGATEVTITINGLAAGEDTFPSLTVPLVVKPAYFARLNLTIDGQNIEAMSVNGVLRGELVLYEGGYTMPAGGFALEDGLAWITTETDALVTREAGTGGMVLKLKKQTANKATSYTLTLPNKQKLVLAVTVANTQPAFLSAAKLFNDLDTPAAVQFKVFKHTRIRDVEVSAPGDAVKLISWSQTSEYVTVWVSAVPNTKAAKKLATTFTFTTADLAGVKDGVEKMVQANLVVAAMPAAVISPLAITAPAFAANSHPLTNNSDYIVDIGNKRLEETPEYTETVDDYLDGFFTVFEGITVKGDDAFNETFTIGADGTLQLQAGKRATAITPGSYRATLTYRYRSITDPAKETGSLTAAATLNLTPFDITAQSLTLQMEAGAEGSNGTPVAQEFKFDLYSHLDAAYGVSGGGAAPMDDQRYGFDTDKLYELHRVGGGKVAGVDIAMGATGTDEFAGMYRSLTMTVTSVSDLLKPGLGAGPFELYIYKNTADAGAAAGAVAPADLIIVPFVPVLAAGSTGGSTVKVGTVSPFNQTEFKRQETTVLVTATPGNFIGTGIGCVMTGGPQMEDPFNFKMDGDGNITVTADTKITRTPAVGTYTYRCTITNAAGFSTQEFTLKVPVKAAVKEILVTARMKGALNPYYSNADTGEGYVTVTFTCNIPNMPLAAPTGARVYATPKKATATVESEFAMIGVDPGKGRLELYCKDNAQLSQDMNYILTNVKLNVGKTYTGASPATYSVTFPALKALPVKASLKYKTYEQPEDWNLALDPVEKSLALKSENTFVVNTSLATTLDPVSLLGGQPLFKLVDGNYVRVSNERVAKVSAITLTGASAKNFVIKDIKSGAVTLEILNDAVRKQGVQKITYSVIPSSCATTAKHQVQDTDGNILYLLTEDFAGKEKFVKCTVNIPKPVAMSQSVRMLYDYALNPAKK